MTRSTAAAGLIAVVLLVVAGSPAAAVTDDGPVAVLGRDGDALAWSAGATADPSSLRLEAVPLDGPSTDLGPLGLGDELWVVGGADGSGFRWDVTPLAPAAMAGDLVDVTLESVEGPGRVALFDRSPFGRVQLLLGSAADAPRRTPLQVGRARSTALAVDAPGTYRLHLAAEAAGGDGVLLRGRTTYTVEAGGAQLTRAAVAAADGTVTAAAAAVVIADGHVDMGPVLDDGDWRIQLKDDRTVPATWRELADVVLHAVGASAIAVPGGFDFLGPVGSQVWMLPQVQRQGVVWPGWNTQHPSLVGEVDGAVTWTLRDVDGPGDLVLFLSGAFGAPQVLFTTRDPLPQEIEIPLNVHAHGNWAFTAAGTYRLTMEMAARSTDGARLSDVRTLTFAVGDVDPAPAASTATTTTTMASGTTTTTRAGGTASAGAAGAEGQE